MRKLEFRVWILNPAVGDAAGIVFRTYSYHSNVSRTKSQHRIDSSIPSVISVTFHVIFGAFDLTMGMSSTGVIS